MIALMFTMASTAFAGDTFEGYNVIAGRINGPGYSYPQIKTTSGANVMLISDGVGGNFCAAFANNFKNYLVEAKAVFSTALL